MKLSPIKGLRAKKFNLYLRPDARKPVIYWSEYREELNPQRQCKSTRFLNPDEFDKAVKFVEDQRALWRGEKLSQMIKSKDRWLFDEAAKNYLEVMKPTWTSKKTLANVSIDIDKHLIPEFGNLLPREISNELWLKYVGRSRAKVKDQKFFNRRKTLIAILTYLHSLPLELEGGATNPNYLLKVPDLMNVDPETAKGKYVPISDFDQILKSCREEKDLVVELQALMGRKMGPRHGEVARMKLKDIDQEEWFIHIPAAHEKRRKSRDIKVSKEVIPLLKRQIRAAEALESPFLFPSPKFKGKHMSDSHAEDLWDAACDRVKIKNVYRFHDLRHTCATDMGESGWPIHLAANQLGMSARTFEKTYFKRRRSALKEQYAKWEGAHE